MIRRASNIDVNQRQSQMKNSRSLLEANALQRDQLMSKNRGLVWPEKLKLQQRQGLSDDARMTQFSGGERFENAEESIWLKQGDLAGGERQPLRLNPNDISD